MARSESYLSSQRLEEGGRPLAALVALKAHMDMVELYKGGWLQFVWIARPVYRNFGLTEQDMQEMWALLERWMLNDRSPFIRKYLGRSPLVQRRLA